MTTDDTRKLLELAAKAVGIDTETKTVDFVNHDGVWRPCGMWNPIESSADCGELEAKLMVCVQWFQDAVTTHCHTATKLQLATEKYADHNGDRQAARRMAVTKLAAKIGGMG